MSNKKTFLNIRPELLICFFLVITTIGVYVQVGTHAFVNYDDELYVIKNPYVRAGLSPESVTWAFTATHASNWHPLTWLSHMADVELYGMNPGQHHLTNVLFHVANTLLLFFVFRRMTGEEWPAAFVAALFALHPVHAESVAWVAERKDVLSTFFWMLTLWGYIRYVQTPGAGRYLMVLLFFILGLMAKPMVVTLPFVLLLLDYWPLRRFLIPDQAHSSDMPIKNQQAPGSGQQTSIQSLITEKIPFFILSAGSSVVTILVQKSGGAVASLESLPLIERIANAVIAYSGYIGKMIWPSQLAVFYSHPRSFSGWHVAGASVLIFSVSLWVIVNIKKRPYLAVGWFWYMGTLLPVIGLVQVGLQSIADRYTYIPFIGLFIMMAWGIPDIANARVFQNIRDHIKNRVIPGFAALILLSLMGATWIQVGYWRNSVTLHKHTLEVTSNNGMAHYLMGNAFLLVQGDTDKAIVHYTESLRLGFDHMMLAHNDLGAALFQKGKTDEAIAHFRAALRINPDYVQARNNLKHVLKLRKKSETKSLFEK